MTDERGTGAQCDVEGDKVEVLSKGQGLCGGNFLTLLCSKSDANRLIERLDKAEPIEHAAKDILRAAQLPALSSEDPHVNKDLKDIQKGKALAPVLLIRGDLEKAHSLVIADGYHRVCASYIVDESAPISCRMVDL